MRAVGFAGGTVYAEQVAVTGGGDGAGFLVAILQIHKHLHLDATAVTGADGRQRIAPDEEAGVADLLRVHVHPIELGDEVLVWLSGPQVAGGTASGDDFVVLDEEGARVAIDVDPAVEIAAIEERNVAFGMGLGSAQRGCGDEQDRYCEKVLHKGILGVGLNVHQGLEDSPLAINGRPFAATKFAPAAPKGRPSIAKGESSNPWHWLLARQPHHAAR